MKHCSEKKYHNIVTFGDPAGVGTIIAAQAFKKHPASFSHCLCIGSVSVLEKFLESEYIHIVTSQEEYAEHKLNIIDIQCDEIEFGKASLNGGNASYNYLEKALSIIERTQTLTTLPICKESWKYAGIEFDGHTEYLAQRTKTKKYAMIFASSFFTVVLATIHTAYKNVPEMLNKDLIVEKTCIGYEFLRAAGCNEPRIAVCGLNPHASENGLFGDEEKTIITPAVNELKENGYCVSGPEVADSVFIKAMNKKYDLVTAMYHDQALIPVKLIDFNGVVNITGGLPFWRISVSHGTAFDIVNKKDPDIRSFISALSWASKLGEKEKTA